MKPIALSVRDAARISGLSRSFIYRLVAERRLVARKANRHTLIMYDSLEAYLETLPLANVAAPKPTV